MRCSQVDRSIEPYLEGRLSPSRRASIEAHLSGCPACRARAAEAEVLRARLEAQGEVPTPPELLARVMSRVYEEERLRGAARARRGPSPVYRRLGYSFMASAALLATSLFIPRLAYPGLLAGKTVASGLASRQPTAVVRILDGAGRSVERVIELQTKGSR